MSEHSKITLVTPAYNSAATIEKTIQSVLNTQYPNLEYMIIDGGSTDGTVEIIKQYEAYLDYWVSEPDKGMYDALQKGFDRSTGEIMGWINSDDLVGQQALEKVNRIFRDLPDIEWITSLYPGIWDDTGLMVENMPMPGFSKQAFFQGEYSYVGDFTIEQIQQESTFWRRSLWEKSGAKLDQSLRLAGDFELWARFFQYADLVGVRVVLGGIHLHPDQMTHNNMDKRIAEERAVLERYDSHLHRGLRGNLRRLMFKVNLFNRAGYRAGLKHQATIATYNMKTRKWETKQTYF